ncbi:WD40 repeat-like protein [Mycena pura]|uniref:WD40 repeat-like protein n=1 Tax=Mycena pura TaxID=153505 RepID=A0AAD6UR72_9AGAR|nr:WD40 repeat-like protein [Mycena pura]
MTRKVQASLSRVSMGIQKGRRLANKDAASVAAEKAQKRVGTLALKDFASALGAIIAKLEFIVRIGDQIATVHPYANMAWKIMTAVYQVAKKQQVTDEKLCKLVQMMADVYSFVDDIDFLDKIKSLEDKTMAIVKQTVECALFVQEYTSTGFCSRSVRNTWSDTDKKIDELINVLHELKGSFDGSLIVQGLFLSTKTLRTLEGLEQLDTLKMLNPVEMNAASRALCLRGTREEILDSISEWVAVPSDSGNILWLAGVAGTGKSTIATSISESLRGLERLGAFLFFDRNDRARSHPDGVIRTIAYSLALSNPHIAAAVSNVIQRDPAVVNAPLPTQFETLLLQPLQSVEHLIQGPILIILDALDECGEPSSRNVLLSTISTEFHKLPAFIRFLITSRHEADIDRHFRTRIVAKELDPQSSAHDIEIFISHEINRIRKQHDLDPAWPEQSYIRQLTNLAGGLFIWASTAIRFIDDYLPEEQLQTLTSEGSTGLDSLYSTAIRNSGPWGKKTFKQDACAVLSCIVLGRIPMTDKTIDMLLGSGRPSARVLEHFRCVIQWRVGAEARMLHASFADYLTDPSRSGGEPWAVDTKLGQQYLSAACLRILMTELRFNICGLEDSRVLNANILDLSDRVDKKISPQLSYSSRFWFNHVQESSTDETILKAVKNFLHGKLLYWFEVLSVLEQIPVAMTALRVAAKYVQGFDDDLKGFLADAAKFVSAFAPVMAQGTPHIYLSALPLAPRQSQIAQRFAGSFPNTVGFESIVGTYWPPIQKILHGRFSVTCVCFSPDSTRIASGSQENTVCIWDSHTGRLVLGPLKGHTDFVKCIHFSPDGERIVSGSDDCTLRVWDSRVGTLISGPMKGHDAPILSVQFSPNGKQLASGSMDGTTRVWDPEIGALVAGPFRGGGSIESLCYSPDGTRIAFHLQTEYGSDRNIYIWDGQTGTPVAGPFKGHTGEVSSVCFSPDGSQIVSGSDDQTVRIWDARTGALVAGPFAGHIEGITSVHVSPDGALIATGSFDRTVRVWDAHAPVSTADREGHKDSVFTVRFSPDGTRVATGSADATVRIWDARTGAIVAGPTRSVPGDLGLGGISAVHFSPDGARIVAGSYDRTIRVWDAHTATLMAGPFLAELGVGIAVQFSPDGARIASGSREICVRDAHTGELVIEPFGGDSRNPDTPGFPWEIRSVCFSSDGSKIASGSKDKTVRVWDSHTGALVVGPFRGHTNSVTSVCFSPDGARVVSGSWDKSSRVWDSRSSSLVAAMDGHTGPIWSVHFSPDGTLIASGSADNTVRVWDSHTGVLVAGPFHGHTLGAFSVHFSPDGRRVAAGSGGGTLRIFEIYPTTTSPLGNFPQYDPDVGWILTATGEPMLWIPPWLSSGLYLPHDTLVISSYGTTKLNLARFVHGTEWQKCIDPELLHCTADHTR